MSTRTSNWRARAACRGTDPEAFFPTAEAGPVYDAQVAVAKSICNGCPVRVDCLDEALRRMPYGIAGGRTPEERRGRRTVRLSEPVALLEAGLRPRAGRPEVAAAGRVLLAAGRPVREIAVRCRVTERTVQRWAARAATANGASASTSAWGGGPGCNQALHRISHTNPLAGTRAEGHRS